MANIGFLCGMGTANMDYVISLEKSEELSQKGLIRIVIMEFQGEDFQIVHIAEIPINTVKRQVAKLCDEYMWLEIDTKIMYLHATSNSKTRTIPSILEWYSKI